MAQVKTLVGELAYVEPRCAGALLMMRDEERSGDSYREVKLNFRPRLTIAYRDQQVIALEQLRMGQLVEVLAGSFDDEAKEVFVMAITVKD